jgi:chromosomal replication initiator protein
MNKAEKLGVCLVSEVADYIATHAKRNIRELEGALHRIVAFAALQGRPIDKHLASETFQGILSTVPKKPEVSLVQKAVADYFKIKPSELRSKKRKRTISIPRQIAMYLARTVTNSSYPDLGVQFGGKDHTTIIHAVKRITKQQESDPDLRGHIESIRQHLDQLC